MINKSLTYSFYKDGIKERNMWYLQEIVRDGDCGFHAIHLATDFPFETFNARLYKNIFLHLNEFRAPFSIEWNESRPFSEMDRIQRDTFEHKSYLRTVCCYFLYHVLDDISMLPDIESKNAYIDSFVKEFQLSEDEDDMHIPPLEIHMSELLRNKYQECLNHSYIDIFFVIICCKLLDINAFIYVKYGDMEYEWMSVKRSKKEPSMENSIFLLLEVKGIESHYDILFPPDGFGKNISGADFIRKIYECNLFNFKLREKQDYSG